MKNYIATVTVKGGAWKGQRQRFEVGPIEANSKEQAVSKALNLVAGDRTIGSYDEATCSPANVRVTKSLVQPA